MRHEVVGEATSQSHVIRRIAAALVLLTMGAGCSYAGNIRQWKRLARHGDADAQTHLGVAYYYGRGAPQDYGKAVYWFEKAAAQGDAEAEFGLAIAYSFDEGVPPSPTNMQTSADWYRKAADQGYMLAEFNLGNAYSNGQGGVPEDIGHAIYWWRKAADQGYAPAEESLANCYITGNGVQKDPVAALKWWGKVAAQGGSLGETAQQNIAVYHNRQKEKQYEAQYEEQQTAEMAKWDKINAGECEIQFTIQNNSRYSIEGDGHYWRTPGGMDQGGAYICDKDDCGSNLLEVVGENGFYTFTSIPPNYHESFQANPHYIFPWNTDSQNYYVKFILPISSGFGAVQVYQFTSSWYRTCDRPVINFNPAMN